MKKTDKSKKMKDQFKFTGIKTTNQKMPYGNQTIPKNNIRVNRSGRGN